MENSGHNSFSIKGNVNIHIAVSAELNVTTYPQALLETCKGLIDDNQFGISVVVAHMACEVATERSLSAAFSSNKIQRLESAILEFMNGYNLANEKNRKLYNALTGEHIEQQPFWLDFKESAKRRNDIMHNGKKADKAEAEKSYRTAIALINHLGQ